MDHWFHHMTRYLIRQEDTQYQRHDDTPSFAAPLPKHPNNNQDSRDDEISFFRPENEEWVEKGMRPTMVNPIEQFPIPTRE
jgi:hypothetical protein